MLQPIPYSLTVNVNVFRNHFESDSITSKIRFNLRSHSRTLSYTQSLSLWHSNHSNSFEYDLILKIQFSLLLFLDYSNLFLAKIEIYFLLNYFISLLQSSSYKNQDYANDEVCLFHLFFCFYHLPNSSTPPARNTLQPGNGKRGYIVFVLFCFSYVLGWSSVFSLFGLYVFCSAHTHTHTHPFHPPTHTHTHTQTDRPIEPAGTSITISFACMFVNPITNLRLILF